jgi:hypothetical protein
MILMMSLKQKPNLIKWIPSRSGDTILLDWVQEVPEVEGQGQDLRTETGTEMLEGHHQQYTDTV